MPEVKLFQTKASEPRSASVVGVLSPARVSDAMTPAFFSG